MVIESQEGEGYTQADWEGHYESDDLGWDLGKVSPPIVRLLEENKLVPGKTIIPG